MCVKVLVTGGNGFIGRAVVAELLSRGHVPMVMDRCHGDGDSEHEIITVVPRPAGIIGIVGDARDATAVTEAVAHCDAVIHLAGVLGTAETIWNPRPAADTNILGGINVLEACSQYKTPLVNITVGNHFENSTYSITKTTVERFVKMYAQFRDLPACNVRAFNVYGPGQSVAQPYGSSRVRKIIPSFIARALHDEPIQVYGDGAQVMDMIYITDAARCLVQALEKGPRDGITYHAGTGRRTTVKEIAEAVRHEVIVQTGIIPVIEHLPMRAGETPGSEVLAEVRSVEILGINPQQFTLLADGLVNTVSFYRKLFGK
jgi:UDP-glucose 4-epimerase